MTIEIVRDSEVPGGEEILTAEALAFVEELHRRFDPRRRRAARRPRQSAASGSPAASGWTSCRRPAASATATGWCRRRPPASSIAASRSPGRRAREDGDQRAELRRAGCGSPTSRTPSTPDLAQRRRQRAINLRDAARGTLAFTSPEGKAYALRDRRAPRRRSSPARAAGTCPRSTCSSTASRGRARSSTSGCTSSTTPRAAHRQRRTARTTTCPKLESHLEARLWNDVFTYAEERSACRTARIRATVLIETIPAAFEMDEILYELREHAVGPERRPLGLPVQHHQGVPRRRAGVRRCPTAPRCR